MPSIQTPKPSSRGPPMANPGLSYWQRTTRAYRHLHSNRNSTVPAASPYVIIGSGIAGALLAFELIQGGVSGRDIAILEAREAASGASSRNAGHVRPDAFRGFQLYSNLHGKEQALKILANERVVLEKVRDFVVTNNVPCDFNYTTTFDVCMTPQFAEFEKVNYERYRNAGGDVSHVVISLGEDAAAKTGVKGAVAAYEWPAGSSHPAKLAQWLLNDVIEKGSQLYTHCPVTQITPSGTGTAKSCGEQQRWDVCTPRGTVQTPAVIHCTNAFAGLLLPQLAAHIVPTRAQAHSLVPVPALSGANILTSTYSLRYSLDHFYSLIQRKGDGTIILGCSLPNPALPKEVRESQFTIDDTYYNKDIANDALEYFGNAFPDIAFDTAVHGENLDHAWNGIIGLTTDQVPFLGPVEGFPGQFVCAGFNGHGMSRIFTSAPGVAQLILNRPWSETGLPECFKFSQARLDKLSASLKGQHDECD